MFAFWLVPHNPVIPIVLFAALGLVQGASFAAVPDLNENIDNRAKAYGAIAQMGNLGNLCGTPLLIAIISIWGFPGIVFAVSAIYLAAVVAHLWLSALRNRHANLH
jgi:nitrate/nitrite transporter NarK